MPKPYTFPLLFDECKRLNITKLKQWEYLKPNRMVSGTVNWHSGETKTGSIGIESCTLDDKRPYIKLSYTYQEKAIEYKVFLHKAPSNLGKGELWFFICPQTGKHCRNLYLVDGLFLHREAFKGGMYETQTYSKYARAMIGEMKRLMLDDVFYKPYAKKYYRGKATKRYQRFLRKIR